MADTRDLLKNPDFTSDLHDKTLSARDIATKYGCGKTFVLKQRKHLGVKRDNVDNASKTLTVLSLQETKEESSNGAKSWQFMRERAVTTADARQWLLDAGENPDDFHTSIRTIAYGDDKWSNKLSAWPKVSRQAEKDGPAWPLIQPADPVVIIPSPLNLTPIAREAGFKLSIKGADTQIGFRILPDGSIDPFHDEKAMDLFVEVVRLHNPDSVVILGDFLDLAQQGRFAQEAAFARTMQLAINAGHAWLARIREAAPNAKIVVIEGNHDVRMQRFVEANAVAAFGLTQANMPESWPVMSLPFLLRLAELNIEYVDAYPAATFWDRPDTRNIHGTRANSKGSTMGQYLHELSHINTWAGHTHRAEIIYRTVIGHNGAPIESYAANPGCLCRTDGSVPSVHGGTGVSGIPATIVEDWQQGFGMLYYNDTESWPYVYRIKNGRTVLGERVISV